MIALRSRLTGLSCFMVTRMCQVLFFLIVTSGQAAAIVEIMSNQDLQEIDGQFSEIRIVSHKNTNDTVRIFLDIHQEVYGTIESARVGYYYKDNSELRSTPLQIGLSGYEGFYHGADNVNDGANFAFIKILSDFNTMAPQNGATLEPWGNGMYETGNDDSVTENCNNFDWDIWVDNLQLGESPDKPQYVNGLIMRFEFNDDLVANPNANLERIIIGTNDIQGNLYFNAQRLTAVLNPLLLTSTTVRSASAVDPYKYTAGANLIQRDPLIQCFGVAAHNVEDRDTGSFIVIDLDGDHLKWTFVSGWPENATNYSFYGGVGSTGLEGIDLWNPDWAPGAGINSGLGGSDPYNTGRQEDYYQSEL